jgi:hypothetical protein
MQVRQQIKDTLGIANTDTLLDESTYSEKQLKEDKIRLERERKQLDKEMGEYADEYKALIKKGAQASEHQRPQLAQRAKIAKKKYKIKKQEYQKNSVVMATVVTIEGARELQNMYGEDTTEIETIIHDSNVNAEAVQEDLMDAMVQFELDMDVMQEVQENLDIDIIGTDMMGGTTEEEEMMEKWAEDDLDDEEIDVDSAVNADADPATDIGLDGENGLGLDEETLDDSDLP